jgi:predicted ATP-grasp superfamily ATP-dependent carboligase
MRWGYDKRLTYRLAGELGIDAPRTYTPASREEVATLDCTFPVILKPAFKPEMNRFTHAKAWRTDNRQELLSAYDQACMLVDPSIIMVQDLIPGGGKEQFSYAALCVDGRPLAWMTARRTRQYPLDFGRSSSYVESVEVPEIEESARRLLKAIGFTGLVEVEFKRDPRDGAYKLLDINSRVWGWHTLGQRAGVDFPYLLWRVIYGQPVPPVRAQTGVRWIRMLTDLPAVFAEMRLGRLSVLDYVRSLCGPLIFAIFAADDVTPAFLDVPLLAMVAWRRNLARPAVAALYERRSKRKRVCMITHSAYDGDNRVIRYAEALAQRGDSVDVFALRQTSEVPKKEVIHGVRVFRIQDRFNKNARSKSAFLWPLLRFLFVSSWQITRRHWRKHYDVVHVHNIPDFLVFAAFYPKLTGSKVILDIHDIVPELFANKFRTSPRSLWIRGLKFVEKLSAKFATHIILSNDLWLEKYASRSAPKEKCSVFINNVDRSVFQPRQHWKRNDKPLIIFPGGLQWHQGLDIALRAFEKLRRRIPNAEFHIYGEGQMKTSLVALAEELGVDGSVRFFSPLRTHEIAEVMSRADLGIVPKRADSFGNEAYSTKIMEFMSLGVPVVVSNTKIDRYYFDDSIVRFFQAGDPDSLAQAMYEVLSNDKLRGEMVSRALQYAAQNSWESRKPAYLGLVDSHHAA